MPRFRGAIASPRHRLAAARPHVPVGITPSQFLWKPAQISMWANDVDGDCVSAEEAFCKACNSPEIFITDDTVVAWATANGFLNGAMLTDVLDLMQTAGFSQDGNLYNDGKRTAVDWTDAAVLQNAIAQGPVKIAVAADQLETAVSDPPADGWFATGFAQDQNLDHCVSLCGYGPMLWLAGQLKSPYLPDGVDNSQLVYAMFSWDSVGIIDVPSLLAITGEAWLRNPSTIVVPQTESSQ